MTSTRFYSDLPTNTVSISQLMGDETRFAAMPADWRVILTDVRKSTQALSEGRHQVVNLVATGSIIAALNIAQREGVSLPFFFGGDGATLLAPPALAERIEQALLVHRANTRANFGLDLRVGSLGLAEVYRQGARLQIAKVDINQGLVVPVALGAGLPHVERIIKRDDYAPPPLASNAALDLNGMECRWDSIRPPDNTQEVVCLLVVARDDQRQSAIFSHLLAQLDAIYGPLASRSPVSLPRLKLKTTLGKIKTEMRAKLGRFDCRYLLENWLRTLIGGLYFRFNPEGAQYLRDLVKWSDTLMIDGRINTIMCGTAVQRHALVETLQRLEDRAEIRFGLQVSRASVISCYVRDRRHHHIHFVDGLGGGYTQAASMLKAKMV
jgi:hypothetical protein